MDKVFHSGVEKKLIVLFLPFYIMRYFFHILAFFYYRKSTCVEEDLFNETNLHDIFVYKRSVSLYSKLCSLCWAFAYDPFFLVLFYHRLPRVQRYLNVFKRDSSSFCIAPCKIGHNLIMHHPMSTFINAKSVGDNVVIRNGCTIGNKNGDNDLRPSIGNNVEFGVNVVVIGNVKIGDNVCLGAGTVITKDVPSNSIAVGNPFRIIFKNK